MWLAVDVVDAHWTLDRESFRVPSHRGIRWNIERAETEEVRLSCHDLNRLSLRQ